MILVILGTQDKSFTRLLDKVQAEIDNGTIKEEAIVQAGCTKYESKDMKIFDLVDREEFSKLVSKANYVISHGGVGSILNCLNNNKKVIVCPRLSKYKEHINDHQKEITNNFYKEGYILKLDEKDDLKEVIKELKDFKPKKYKSNNSSFIKIIEDFIEKDN